VKTLLATIHVAFVGWYGNLVYRIVSWIPVLGNLWEVPVEGSHNTIYYIYLKVNTDDDGADTHCDKALESFGIAVALTEFSVIFF
jgi:hypothetical protein